MISHITLSHTQTHTHTSEGSWYSTRAHAIKNLLISKSTRQLKTRVYASNITCQTSYTWCFSVDALKKARANIVDYAIMVDNITSVLRDTPNQLSESASIRQKLYDGSALPAPLGEHFHKKLELTENRHAAVLANAPLHEKRRRGRKARPQSAKYQRNKYTVSKLVDWETKQEQKLGKKPRARRPRTAPPTRSIGEASQPVPSLVSA